MYRENKGRHISGSQPGGPQQREGELKCPGPFTSPSLTNPSEVHRDFSVCIYTSVFQHVYSVNSTVFFQLPLAIFFPLLLMNILDSNSSGTPYESLPNVFQMLGLGTSSELFQSLSLPWGMCFLCNPTLKRSTLCWGFHWRMGVGKGQDWGAR